MVERGKLRKSGTQCDAALTKTVGGGLLCRGWFVVSCMARFLHVGCYRQAQSLSGCFACDGVNLYLGGALSWNLGGVAMAVDAPCIYLTPRAASFSVVYGRERCNWVAQVEGLGLVPSAHGVTAQLGPDVGCVELAPFRPLTAAQAARLASQYARMQHLLRVSHPAQRFRAVHCLWQCLELLLHVPVADDGVPRQAVKLKELLDDDERLAVPITDLVKACGSSDDHLRILFRNAYGCLPGSYRQARRLEVAQRWLRESELSVKEIAHRLGYAHATAFSAAFRAGTGLSPRQARQSSAP